MPTFIRPNDYKDSDTKEQLFANPSNRYTANQNDFSKIPGSPIAYWVSTQIFEVFIEKGLGSIVDTCAGLSTTDNELFVRFWTEVCLDQIGLDIENSDECIASQKRWFPFIKGGEYRKWYGNNENVVNWKNNGEDLRNYIAANPAKQVGGRIINEEFYFLEGANWGVITSGILSCRYSKKGAILSNASGGIFSQNKDDVLYSTVLLNSKISMHIFSIINPTVNFSAGTVAKLPIILPQSNATRVSIISLTQECINTCQEEWDMRERSMEFKQNELIRHKTDDGKIASAFSAYCDYWRDKFHRLHTNEEELNRLFIEIYGLQDELTPDVAFEDITILKSESRIENGELVFNADEIARQFISYAVGCMFGRYTLDREGLVVANMEQDYPTDTPFAIDDDNIIPVLEEEVFADDIAARFERFVAVAFGEEKVAENLRWIEEALGMNIRKYFYGEFYKDHVKRYKKRPIYWLIQSPKKGFSALIYMHRYQSDTMARVQTMYLREYLTKLESLIEHHNTIASNPSSSAKEAKDAAKLATKLEGKHRDALDFDRGDMSRIAAEQIVIDLDDGVKVNYQKFKGVLPDIGLAKGED